MHGYEENGFDFAERRGERGERICFRITRDRWQATRTDIAIEVAGFERCAEMFGLS